MCLILHNPKGVLVDIEIIETALCFNSDGFGIFYHDTHEVRRTLDFDKAVELCSVPRPYTAHFRYATSGPVTKKNCHPFKIDSRYLLMQNGTVEHLRSKDKVDTSLLADVLARVPRDNFRDLLETHPCRFAVCDTQTGEVELFNEHLWHEHDGCLYSKRDVLDDVFFSYTPKLHPESEPGIDERDTWDEDYKDAWDDDWDAGLRGSVKQRWFTEPYKEDKPSKERFRVAVYGTLKQGNHNHEHHLGDAYYLGSGKTVDAYPLVVSGLPYVLKRKGAGHRVKVEVYDVSTEELQRLDRLESHPHWYRREQVQIKCDSGETVEAWLYFMTDNSVDNGIYLEEY
jgi:gamma-glutamylcyclotransferase (GGCT)/AIG2-like uncharacterized protein YtfP